MRQNSNDVPFSRLLALLIAYSITSAYATESAPSPRLNEVPNSRAGNAWLGGLPLSIESAYDGGSTRGAVSGTLDFSYATVRQALREPAGWCALLALHLNVKACIYSQTLKQSALSVYVGEKGFQPAAQATVLHYAFEVEHDDENLLAIRLHAPQGPLGTGNYEMKLRVTPHDADHTLVDFHYRYEMGTRGRLALQGYLSTVGRAKVGFTLLAAKPGVAAGYVSGIRGVTERNVVRYFLAIMAYLECLSPGSPVCADLPAAAARWFDLTARFPLQLFELSREAYLHNKRRELAQQSQLQGITTPP